MTQRSDIERVLDLWLADGPTHVPDRVFDDAVSAVYRAPQRSPWRLRWRNLKVSTRLLVAASIALVAVAGVGLLIMAGSPTPAPTPTPTAGSSATPAPTDAAATDDSNLCQPSSPECTGPLAAGTHSTAAVLSPVRYTVPEGWQKPLDVPGAMNLEAGGAPPNTIIAVWPDWQIMSQSTCRNEPEADVGRGVEDLLAFLVDHPGLVASEPERIVLGGLPGVVLDIRRDPDWSGPCTSAVNLFTHQGTINDIGWQDISGDRVNRLWLLDGPDGHVTNVAIEAPNSDAFDAFVAIATTVIESFRFQREAPCLNNSPCVGALLPGRHLASPPFGQPFTYEVPEGWTNPYNGDDTYVLQQTDKTSWFDAGIFISPRVAAASQPPPCTMAHEPGVGRTAAELATWIGTLPGFTQSPPVEMSVGGLAGLAFDLTVSADAPICSGDAKYLLSGERPAGDQQRFWWGLAPSNRVHLILLDDGARGSHAIVVEAPTAEFGAFVGAAMPIVESFDFAP